MAKLQLNVAKNTLFKEFLDMENKMQTATWLKIYAPNFAFVVSMLVASALIVTNAPMGTIYNYAILYTFFAGGFFLAVSMLRKSVVGVILSLLHTQIFTIYRFTVDQSIMNLF